jgi:hypothetical protein
VAIFRWIDDEICRNGVILPILPIVKLVDGLSQSVDVELGRRFVDVGILHQRVDVLIVIIASINNNV